MNVKAVIKVGLFTVGASALFGGLYFYLAHFSPNVYRIEVPFPDTKGLLVQSVVRMQGVAIGEVESIDLNTADYKMRQGTPPRPVVTLAIQNRYAIPADSSFVIVSGLLITNPQVEIKPGKSNMFFSKTTERVAEKYVKSGNALDAISPELAESTRSLKQLLDNLNSKFDTSYAKIDSILGQTQKLLATSTQTIQTAQGLIGDKKIQTALIETLTNFKDISKNAKATSTKLAAQLENVFAQGGTVDEVKEKVFALFDRIDNTLEEANTVVKKLTEQVTDPRLQQSLQETVELARTTLARFNQIASDLHTFTGDAQLQSDLKQTVTNLKNATQKGEEAVGKVNNLLGKVAGPDGKVRTPSLPKVELSAFVSEQIDPERFRVDLEARIGLGKRNLVNLGLFDVGQDTRLILQGGHKLNDSLTARYGLYASRLGAGMEWRPTSGMEIRGDVYDTRRPRLDLRTSFRVNKNASIWVGADGLFQRPVPRLGVQFTR